MQDFEFFSFPPEADLAPFVDCIWGVRGRAAGFDTEAVLPNGAIELMVNFGPVQQVVGHGDESRRDTYRRAWLAGIQDRRLVHSSPEGVDHIAVRFRPGGAHAFLRVPMDETTNRVVELDTLLGAQVDSLRDRLGALTNDRDRAEALQHWLRQRRSAHPAFATVRRAIDMLGEGGDFRTPVGSVCERLGLSNKHLIEQFRNTVGLPPKTVGRIARFRWVVSACRGRQRVDWTSLAAAAGYADQAHLIREFRRLGSATPTEFLAARTPDESAMIVA